MTTATDRSLVQLKNKLHKEITKYYCIYAASNTCFLNYFSNSWSPICPISAIKDCNFKCSDLPPIIVSLCMQTRMKLTDQTLWLFTLSLIEVVWDLWSITPLTSKTTGAFIWLWALGTVTNTHKYADT